jgi:hypothetical protein
MKQIDYVIQKIVEDSDLTYFPITDIKNVDVIQQNMPAITSSSSIYNFTTERAWIEVTLSVIFPKTPLDLCDDKLIHYNQIMEWVNLYTLKIMDINLWLSGKKLVNLEPYIDDFDEDTSKRSKIKTYFSLSGENKHGSLLVNEDVIVIEGKLYFVTDYYTCCDFFQPVDPDCYIN